MLTLFHLKLHTLHEQRYQDKISFVIHFLHNKVDRNDVLLKFKKLVQTNKRNRLKSFIDFEILSKDTFTITECKPEN